MREEITYKNIASIGELYIVRMVYIHADFMGTVRLSPKVENAMLLDKNDIKDLRKHFNNKVKIETLKLEVM